MQLHHAAMTAAAASYSYPAFSLQVVRGPALGSMLAHDHLLMLVTVGRNQSAASSADNLSGSIPEALHTHVRVHVIKKCSASHSQAVEYMSAGASAAPKLHK